MRVGGQRHALAALPPGKSRHPLYRRLGGPQGRSKRVGKISPPSEFDIRTVQSEAVQTAPQRLEIYNRKQVCFLVGNKYY